jgi:Sec-independent protein secretion pathway components
MPGLADLLLILFVILLIFGASKLPAIATAMGKTILSLRDKTYKNHTNNEARPSRSKPLT